MLCDTGVTQDQMACEWLCGVLSTCKHRDCSICLPSQTAAAAMFCLPMGNMPLTVPTCALEIGPKIAGGMVIPSPFCWKNWHGLR